jgi:Holliday junction resolvasome RuvABC ATP-dependent DNA helicase subunit
MVKIYTTPYGGGGIITLQASSADYREVATRLPPRLANRILKEVGEQESAAIRIDVTLDEAERILAASKV